MRTLAELKLPYSGCNEYKYFSRILNLVLSFHEVQDNGSLIAQELSNRAGVSIMLATERLLVTEKAGGVCRDESVTVLSKPFSN
uniref:Uncharacterized protein n=1 Tax=Amphimedon queenslandica TaxID=400682 RepID=A0A1X7VKR5_AMPQE